MSASRAWLLVLACALGFAALPHEAASQALQTTTVYLVRHAERDAGNDADPGLSAAGRARAEDLRALLAEKPIAAAEILAAFGIQDRISICESEYDLLFELVLGGAKPVLASIRYGAPTPAAAGCGN